MALLELKDIQKIYHKGETTVNALKDVSLSIEKGEFLAIVGPSGSGKTTLLNIVGCLDTPTSGSVRYNGKELGTFNEKALSRYRKGNIGFVFQAYNLIPVLNVQENVELPLIIERTYSKKEIAAKAKETIEAVGLSSMGKRLPRELSGGQEQRVAIARALVKHPLVVLADEPTANLDSKTAEDIMELMQSINQTRETTFVFSTHDSLVMRYANRVVTLHDGAVVEDARK